MKSFGSVVFTLVCSIVLLTMTAAAQDAIPKVIKGGILNGKAVSLPTPTYPPDAKAERVEGVVHVDVEIDENGMVSSAVALDQPRKIKQKVDDEVIETEVYPADLRLRNAAEQAALQARFSPTRLSGQPVRIQGTIVYNFAAVESEDVIIKDSEDDVLSGQAISLPHAVYPAAARAVRAQGVVNVQILVSEGGYVTSAAAVSGHPLLRASAVDAARVAKFNPQTKTVSGVLTYTFALPKGDPK